MPTFLAKYLKPGSDRLRGASAGPGTEWWFIVVGAIVGSLTGLGAIAFDKTLEYVTEHVEHAQHVSIWMLIAAPVVGMGLSGLLIRLFASDARGHGVPQVMKALIKRGGIIRWPTGVTKSVASILTVGSGGSGGTEGPIIQIGATVGSVVGQRLGLTREHMGTLVGCGAAAGISSIFNAPIAGVFFVLEILLRDFSVKAFAPIVVASVFSQATTQAVLGQNDAIFATPMDLDAFSFSLLELPGFVLLGIVCGLAAVAFNKLLHWFEDVYEKWDVNALLKPVSGALALGVLGVAYVLVVNWAFEGEPVSVPAFYGNGYATIRELLDPASYTGGTLMASSMTLLVALVALKILATVFTLGSGGSGGMFAPSLCVGAIAGAALGVALDRVGLMPEGGSPAAYALVGMAAVVAGTTHATLTSILLLFELTRNIYVLLPIMLAAVIATVVASVLERDSIYTYKLRREGVLLGAAKDISVLRRVPVTSVAIEPLPVDAVFASDPLGKLVSLHANYHVPDFVVVEQDGSYIGMVTGKDMRTALIDREAIPLLLVAELLRTDLPVIFPDETLDAVVDRFAEHDVSSLCLVTSGKSPKPVGLITRANVMSRYRKALEES